MRIQLKEDELGIEKENKWEVGKLHEEKIQFRCTIERLLLYREK